MTLGACYAGADVEAVADINAPRICEIAEAYNDYNAKTWMFECIAPALQITDSDTDTGKVLDNVVNILFRKYSLETCRTWAVFCSKLMTREYKISYGTIKPDAILDASADFLKNMLPDLRRRAQRREVTEEQHEWSEGWSLCTTRSLFKARISAAIRLYNEKRGKGLAESLLQHDEYCDSVQTAIGSGVLTFGLNGLFWDRQRYRQIYEQLKEDKHD